MRMMALSMMMPCEYFKEWIEGSTDDRETLVRFEAEYGQTRGTWLRRIESSFDMTTYMVYGKFQRANSLAVHFLELSMPT